jgi:prevent-host-death family protein
MPIAEARARFSEIVDAAQTTHERIEVTRNGRRAAVLLGADDYDTLLETLDILADADLMTAIAEAEAELACGEWCDEAEVREALRQAGRG